MNFILVEALNGMLMVALFWMSFFGVLHLQRVYYEARDRHRSVYETLREVYLGSKLEIALLVIITALGFRTSVLWFTRFALNHNIARAFTAGSYDEFLLSSFTAALFVGVACWVRVITPQRNRMSAWWMWLALVGTALFIGIGSVMLPVY